MSNTEAIRTLQHASEYIFSSRIASGSRKRMRRTTELWQAMATLHECRNSLQLESQAAAESTNYRNLKPRPMLVCSLSA